MLVMKFGGTSVGNAEAIKRVAAIVAGRVEFSPAVVVSAVAKTTDELVSLGRYAEQGDRVRCRGLIEWVVQKHLKIASDLKLIENVRLKEIVTSATESLWRLSDSMMISQAEDLPGLRDECLSMGEFLSCNILAEALRRRGVNAVWVDSKKVVVTDSRFGRARPSLEASEAKAKDLVAGAIQRGQVPVFQGFVGADAYSYAR